MKLYQAIAAAIQARENCKAQGNTEWHDIWSSRLDTIARDALPSGSGIDNGTRLRAQECRPDRIILFLSFHHMNDAGMYDGWTDHKVTVRPTFDGIAIDVGGRNRNDIKEYLAETLRNALSADYAWPNPV